MVFDARNLFDKSPQGFCFVVFPRKKAESVVAAMAGEAVVQDQRQRTLQALERRFEAAKAELDLHQTKKNTKRLKTEGAGKKPHVANSSAVDSSPKLANALSTTPSKKGLHLCFSLQI